MDWRSLTLRAATVSALVLAIVVPLTGSAMSDMSDASMTSATNAARNGAHRAAEYQICGVNSNAVLATLLEKANGCKASQSQQAQLQSAFNTEFSSYIAALKQQGASCPWSLAQAQTQFDNMIAALKQSIASGGC